MIKLFPDFREFLELLNAHNVRYLLVGGYALAAHGVIRTTGDMDVWFDPSPANIQQLLEVLREFGFSSLPLSEKDLARPETVIQLGYPPVRIDLMNAISGVVFREAYEKRIILRCDNIEISCISLEDLKTNKRSTGRLTDLADLDRLEKL